MRLIDAEALDEQIWNIKAEWGNDNLSLINQGEVSDLICEAPTIEERKVGYWEKVGFVSKCSVCGDLRDCSPYLMKSELFCRRCGAKMENYDEID